MADKNEKKGAENKRRDQNTKDVRGDKNVSNKSKSSNTDFETIIIILLLIAVVSQVLFQGPAFRGGLAGFFDNLRQGVRIFVAREVYVGSRVSNVADVTVYTQPVSRIAGFQDAGSQGTISQCPVLVGDFRFWNVQYDFGPSGWVREDLLFPVGEEPFPPLNVSVGSLVHIISPPEEEVLRRQVTVVGGPIFFEGVRWWNVEFETEMTGWVEEGWLFNTQGERFSPQTLVGQPIRSIARVFDSPGGRVIETQETLRSGIVVEGPQVSEGERFWRIDYERGVDGWVNEELLRREDGSRISFPDMVSFRGELIVESQAPVFESAGRASPRVFDPREADVIAGGPRLEDGQRQWLVSRSFGPSIWVFERNLLAETGEIFLPLDTSVGERITSSATVLADPGGSIIGTQTTSRSGLIIECPRFFAGQRYWLIDYDDNTEGWVLEDELMVETGRNIITSFYRALKIFSVTLAIVVFVGLILVTRRLSAVRKRERQLREVEAAKYRPKEVDPRWNEVEDLITSEDPSDWKKAIIRADDLLFEILSQAGLMGKTLEDKIENIKVDYFENIRNVKEAIDIKNMHQKDSGDTILSQREAERAVVLYKKAFDEVRSFNHGQKLKDLL